MAKYLDNDGVLYLWSKIKGLFNKGITNLSVNGKVITFTKGDGTTGTITTQDTNTTYSNMTGATSSAAGKAGLVPAPAAGKQTSFLRGDGTWVVPTDTKYSVATQSANGLMSSTDKTKLDGIATGANKTVVDSSMSDTSTNPVQNKIVKKYVDDRVPSPPTGENGIYYMQAHVSSDGNATNIGWAIPDIATSNHDGFMSSAMASKLNAFQNASAYALKSDITNMYKYKGSVTNSSNLPTSGQSVGDTYNIVNASTYGPAGTNVSWDGSKWDALGGLFEIESITNSELDTICV